MKKNSLTKCLSIAVVMSLSQLANASSVSVTPMKAALERPEYVEARWFDEKLANEIAEHVFKSTEIKEAAVKASIISAKEESPRHLSSFLQGKAGGFTLNNYHHIISLSKVLSKESDYAKSLHQLGLEVLAHDYALVDKLVVHPWFNKKFGDSVRFLRNILSGKSPNSLVDRGYIEEILVNFHGKFELYQDHKKIVKLEIPGVLNSELMTRHMILLLDSAFEYYYREELN